MMSKRDAIDDHWWLVHERKLGQCWQGFKRPYLCFTHRAVYVVAQWWTAILASAVIAGETHPLSEELFAILAAGQSPAAWMVTKSNAMIV